MSNVTKTIADKMVDSVDKVYSTAVDRAVVRMEQTEANVEKGDVETHRSF